MSETYNGWANYETWNVALWIQNDEGIYDTARMFRHRANPYSAFVDSMRQCGFHKTPDGVLYRDQSIDHDELNAMFEEL
jgi:hypothetical protein